MQKLSTTQLFKAINNASPEIKRIGLIVLSDDEIGDRAFTAIMPKDKISVFSTRTAYVENQEGFSLATSFAEVTKTLPPPGRLDVLAFSCTSGSVALGAQNLLAQLAEARPDIKYTSPSIAVVGALRELGAKKIAMLTPYSLHTHQSFIRFFNEHGFEVGENGTFACSTDATIAELSRVELFDAAKALVHASRPDVLFVSCTATPIVPHIDALEEEIGISVVSSSQAMAWDTLRLAGYSQPILGYGRLLACER